uniref:Uncharacterized protein n=1 Tax=Schistocephalus solidus TaxID=70667 RepID=A0A0X3PKV0_SCHSO
MIRRSRTRRKRRPSKKLKPKRIRQSRIVKNPPKSRKRRSPKLQALVKTKRMPKNLNPLARARKLRLQKSQKRPQNRQPLPKWNRRILNLNPLRRIVSLKQKSPRSSRPLRQTQKQEKGRVKAPSPKRSPLTERSIILGLLDAVHLLSADFLLFASQSRLTLNHF